jgi:hypothetical protein
MTKHLRGISLTAMSFLLTIPLHADILNPGDSVSPVTGVAVPANVNLLADITRSFDFGSTGVPHLTGNFNEVVLYDVFGLTCSSCLDFAFNIEVNQGQPFSVYSAILGNFTGFTTNVVYAMGTGAIIPGSASRGSGAAGVGDFFGTIGSPTLGPGQDSVYLVIATNATAYDSLGTAFINGSDGQASTCTGGHCRSGQVNNVLQPSAVPEPSSVILMSTLLLGMALVMRRRLPSGLATRAKS